MAENEATYTVLLAYADGTVVETLGEPGQVVSAGQTVVRIAQAGPREAVVALPETVRPAIGSVTYLIRHQGEPTIMLAAVMQDGWDGLALGKALEDRTAAIAATLPLGMTLDKVTDQAVNITHAVDEFMTKFAMALGVVLLVSLGWRVGIVMAAAVPLTLAVVFLIMLETGRFFVRITLGALILALGLLVDDAVIAIEVMVVEPRTSLSFSIPEMGGGAGRPAAPVGHCAPGSLRCSCSVGKVCSANCFSSSFSPRSA